MKPDQKKTIKASGGVTITLADLLKQPAGEKKEAK